MSYIANEKRYEMMAYSRCGKSGIKLPRISLGLWHNFGDKSNYETMEAIITRAFDLGITHFDVANNYGPKPGAAETNFGSILKNTLKAYRDELIISTKAGYTMWSGPYGDWGSKKYLVSSLDRSLQRMGLDYVDIFYHHRPDTETPIEETASALDLLVRQGKALYIGISNYSAEQTSEIMKIFKELKTPCIIHQPCYNMMDRWVEKGLTDVLLKEGLGAIAFCPLAQGILTDRYLKGIPEDSRASSSYFLKPERVNNTIETVKQLNAVALGRGQSLAQMSLAWLLKNPAVTSVLIGASKVSQLEENVKSLDNLNFTEKELKAIDGIIFK